MTAYHLPVLLSESVAGLVQDPEGVYVDLTFGGGGHAQAILGRLGGRGRLYAFDQDHEAMANALEDGRLTLTQCNFKYFMNYLRYFGVERVDGILADLGVSSRHLDSPDRGFSFRHRGPLDMRMNRQAPLTAAMVVNRYSGEQLRGLLRAYGELPDAGRLAGRILKARTGGPIETVEALAELIGPLFPPGSRNKMLAKAFQALRIEVNGEVDSLREMLLQTPKALKAGGRLVVISYHSLEDRLVKTFMRTGKLEGQADQDLYGNPMAPLTPHNRRVIVPSEQEVEANPRARSAKLRIAVKR